MQKSSSLLRAIGPTPQVARYLLRREVATTAILLLVIVCAASCKSTLQKEAEAQAQAWWDATFVKCGDGYYTKYSGGSVYMGKDLSEVRDALVQFRQAKYGVAEKTLTNADKANGIEWQGAIIVPATMPLRYYEFGPYGHKWSSWREGPMLYSDKLTATFNDLHGEINSPQMPPLKKVNGQWIVPNGPRSPFTKPQCSELPKE